MKLRDGQMDDMARARKDAFVERMAAHLGENFPDQMKKNNLTTKDLDPLIRRGMEEAPKYGVENEGDVERYVECMVILGPDFDRAAQHKWAGDILRRQDISGEDKIDEISWQVLTQWEEAPGEDG